MAYSFLSSITNKLFGSIIEQPQEASNNLDNNEILFRHEEEDVLNDYMNTNEKFIPFVDRETKVLIANEIINGESSPEQIKTRYNINQSRVNYFARKVRLQQNIQSNCGRPKVIDNLSDLILAQKAQDIKNIVDIQDNDRKVLFKKAIKKEYQQSFLRKQVNNDVIVKKVTPPHRTVRRYLSKYDIGIKI